MRSRWCCRDGSMASDAVDGMQTCEKGLVISAVDLFMRKCFCSAVCALPYPEAAKSIK